MADFLSDLEIADLIAEKKPLPANYRSLMKLKPKRGHSELDLDIVGVNGSEFRLIARRSNVNPLDFSVILMFRRSDSNQSLRLRRYNGKSHEHTNPIEKQTFYDFHIHYATERYQRTGNREDTFAEVTIRYANLEQATECLLSDCGFDLPQDPQQYLFSLGGAS